MPDKKNKDYKDWFKLTSVLIVFFSINLIIAGINTASNSLYYNEFKCVADAILGVGLLLSGVFLIIAVYVTSFIMIYIKHKKNHDV